MSLLLSGTGDELKAKFFALENRGDIAKLLDVNEKDLIYYLYILPRNTQYKSFDIAKKSGTKRRISAPSSSLKILQRKLNQILHYIYPAKPSVHGFIQNKNVLTNARTHLRRRFILNIDLKDFFPSINFGRVRGMFMAQPYKLNEEVATILAQICCFQNQLPQGAPTSPIISNMICAKLDDQLQRLAKRHQCAYTRYADDITISTHLSKFPEKVAKFSEDTGKCDIGVELLHTIKSNGFEINTKKTRLQTRSRRQQVTGVIVNKKLNVKRKYVNQIRAMLHAWEKYKLEGAEREFRARYNVKRRFAEKRETSFVSVVRGKIEYLGMVRGKDNPTYIKFYNKFCELAGVQNKFKIAPHIIRRNNIIPKIITEGKTDWKHIKVALGKLHSLEIHKKLNVNFEEYEDNMPAGGGAMRDHCKHMSYMSQDTMTIYIFDNDDKTIVKDVIEKDKTYKSWGNNVFSFVIPVPDHRQERPEISIEMYYEDSEITRMDKDGRRLFLSNEFSPRSGLHRTELLNCTDINKFRIDNKVSIIDDKVFNRSDQNVALSKNKFAEYIIKQEDNFNDFNYTRFSLIFDIIQLIIDENSS